MKRQEIMGGDLRTRYGRWADYRFRAFISYSHADAEWAEKIEARLTRFVMPLELTAIWTPFGPPPRRMKPVFRDRSQARAHHDKDNVLADALDDSAALIVVCSPSAARSSGVNFEIEHFIARGRRDRIFPIIVDGEPGDGDRDPFPPSLRKSLEAEQLTHGGATPLAADARPGKDGWPGALLKVVAGMAGVDLGLITRDDQRRERFEQFRRFAGLAGALMALVFAGVGAFALNQRSEALTVQSKFLARSAEALTEAGDTLNGALLALQALPGKGEILPRPEVDSAKAALATALANNRLLSVLSGHEGAVTAVAFSPDSKRLATASGDKTARLWDAETGAEIAVLRGHEGTVTAVAFSLDGKRLATASDDDTARIWDAETGADIAVLGGHENDVTAVAFSPDGKRLATASWDKTARLWDAATGAERAVLRGHEKLVKSVAFSPDGKRLATASWDGTARLWDLEIGAEIAVLRGHEEEVNAVAFSPDGKRLATISGFRVKLWRGHDGKLLSKWKIMSSAGNAPQPVQPGMSSTERETARLQSLIRLIGRRAAFSTDLRRVAITDGAVSFVYAVDAIPPYPELIRKACEFSALSPSRRAQEAILADNFLDADAPPPCERVGMLSGEWWRRRFAKEDAAAAPQ